MKNIKKKIKTFDELVITTKKWKSENKKIVFTNGCFDILHFGHLSYLANAKEEGDFLVVALNSSNSISRLKGEHRPINDDLTRVHMMASLDFVDSVVVFDEDTPYELIKKIIPNILVKGGDWKIHEIVGSDIVIKSGGEVKSLPFVKGYSTTRIVEKIKTEAFKEFKKNYNLLS